MNTLTLIPTHQTLTPTQQRVTLACKEALIAEANYAQKAVIAGMLLAEYRASLSCPSHSETGRTNGKLVNNQHSSSDSTFISFCEQNGVSKATAYRWINAADRVSRAILKIPAAQKFDNVIDIEGTPVHLSQALTAPEAELSADALNFRQSFFTFMQDKTLAEAARAAVDGESPAHRITRAATGKIAGGTNGEDRKAFHTFIAEKLSDINTHLKAWSKLSGAQKESIEESLARALEKWPTPLVESLAKMAKTELTRR